MSSSNMTVVREFTRIFKNEHNTEGVDHLFHPDFSHNFRQDVPLGLDGFKAIGRAMNGTFPDVRVTEEDLIDAGDTVVERSSASATHKGDFLGPRATGKTVHWTEIHIYRMSAGRIIEHWVEWSDRELFQQLAPAADPVVNR